MSLLPAAIRRAAAPALLACLAIGPPAHAQEGCAGELAGLMSYAGTDRGLQLLDEAPVAATLQKQLGPEVAHLKRNLAVAGPVDLISCDLVLSGNAEHRGGEENAIVDIDLYSGAVAAAILSQGKIAIYADTGKTLPGMEYAEAVPLAIKDWLAVVYTKFYFLSQPPPNARLLPPR